MAKASQIIKNNIKKSLQKKCDELNLVYTEEDTNADLCTKIDNFNNA